MRERERGGREREKGREKGREGEREGERDTVHVSYILFNSAILIIFCSQFYIFTRISPPPLPPSLSLSPPVAPIIITEPESVTRINVNKSTFDIGCGSKANPRAVQHIIRSLRNGSNGTYYRGPGHLVNLYNVTYDDAGNYTCTVSNGYGSDERRYEVIVQG